MAAGIEPLHLGVASLVARIEHLHRIGIERQLALPDDHGARKHRLVGGILNFDARGIDIDRCAGIKALQRRGLRRSLRGHCRQWQQGGKKQERLGRHAPALPARP